MRDQAVLQSEDIRDGVVALDPAQRAAADMVTDDDSFTLTNSPGIGFDSLCKGSLVHRRRSSHLLGPTIRVGETESLVAEGFYSEFALVDHGVVPSAEQDQIDQGGDSAV
jgi:hypothetical protein